jgi:GTP-binding protein
MGGPLVVIVGRPNVGKSTLFNRMLRRRVSIVEDTPGVTRDRVYGQTEWEDRRFTVVDTGGLYTDADEDMLSQVKEQVLYAIQEADLIVALFDGREGLTEADREIVRLLRETNKKAIYVVNKIDSPKQQHLVLPFYELGIEPLKVSAQTGYGFQEFMETLLRDLPQRAAAVQPFPDSVPKIAIVGRPNVGKSTLVNALVGKERMIVSPVPGTTRDAIDTVCRYYGRAYLLIDTAGLRRKSRISYNLERYMVLRAIRAVERADVVLLIIDSLEGITEQDQKIAALTERYGKSLIVAFSKWDLVENPESRYATLMYEFQRDLHFVSYAPVLTLSGLTRKRVTKVFPLVDELMEERKKRISTGQLNRFADTIRDSLPSYKGKRTKLFYITQVETEPPGFVLFVNYTEPIKRQYLRYIERKLRQTFGFKGTPIRIYVRKRD